MRNLIQSLNPRSYHARPFLGPRTSYTVASQGGLLINIDSATGDIARTTSGFIENEKHGIWYEANVATSSAEFDTSVVMTGAKCLKLSATNATGRAFATLGLGQWTGASATVPNLSKFGIPTKPSTKYKFVCRVKGTNHLSNSSYLAIEEFNAAGTRLASNETTRLPAGNSDVYITKEFTSNAATAYRAIAFVGNITAGNLCDTYYDLNSMVCDEVVEPVANSLTSSSPSLVSFTAVGSTDNIDQSQLTNNASQGLGTTAEQKLAQPFTPTKTKYAGFIMQKGASVGTFVGNITASVVSDNAGSPGSTVYATKIYTAAEWNTIANTTDFTVSLPCNLPVGVQYWEQLECSTADNTNYALVRINSGGPTTLKAYNGSTWGAISTRSLYFKSLYYKPTTGFKASQNNQSVSISTDENGFLEGSIINVKTRKFTWDSGIGSALYNTKPYYADYSKTGGAGRWYPTTGNRIYSGGANEEWIWKLPPGLSNITCSVASTISGGSTMDVSSSVNGSNYTAALSAQFVGTGTLLDGARFLKIKSNGSTVKLESITISATIDLSTIPTLRNYPTNKDVVKQYFATLGSPTTTATYRATKWGFPAIEYSSTEYQYLDRDTTATGSVVAFSELGTSYTTVADGASITIASTSTPSIFVKANITANRLLLSSNDSNASADKDGSAKQSVVYQV